jgi:recombination protein RecA
MSLEVIIAKLNKQYGDNLIGFAKDLRFTEVPRLPSGSLFLDWALGQNEKQGTSGWPRGRIVELYGPESSGKSLISMKTIAEAQKQGLVCAYIDCENTFDRTFASKLGVNPDKLLLSRESQGEKVIDGVWFIGIKGDRCDCI